MGEAKRRGTREQRKAESIALKQDAERELDEWCAKKEAERKQSTRPVALHVVGACSPSLIAAAEAAVVMAKEREK